MMVRIIQIYLKALAIEARPNNVDLCLGQADNERRLGHLFKNDFQTCKYSYS